MIKRDILKKEGVKPNIIHPNLFIVGFVGCSFRPQKHGGFNGGNGTIILYYYIIIIHSKVSCVSHTFEMQPTQNNTCYFFHRLSQQGTQYSGSIQ